MSRPYSRYQPAQPQYRTNGRIRAREVRVIGVDGGQLGVLELSAAIKIAIQQGVDLVEIAPTAVPPVCRLVDYGKFKYEQAKKDKDSRKHHHSNEVKEIQLTPRIDPHDMGIKMEHAIGFLCEEMKVKLALRFRGRELAHKENGFNVVKKFLTDIAPWGHADNEPKLNGKMIQVMLSPQPKHKRAKNPHEDEPEATPPTPARPSKSDENSAPVREPANSVASPAVLNSPFAELDLPPGPPVAHQEGNSERITSFS